MVVIREISPTLSNGDRDTNGHTNGHTGVGGGSRNKNKRNRKQRRQSSGGDGGHADGSGGAPISNGAPQSTTNGEMHPPGKLDGGPSHSHSRPQPPPHVADRNSSRLQLCFLFVLGMYGLALFTAGTVSNVCGQGYVDGVVADVVADRIRKRRRWECLGQSTPELLDEFSDEHLGKPYPLLSSWSSWSSSWSWSLPDVCLTASRSVGHFIGGVPYGEWVLLYGGEVPPHIEAIRPWTWPSRSDDGHAGDLVCPSLDEHEHERRRGESSSPDDNSNNNNENKSSKNENNNNRKKNRNKKQKQPDDNNNNNNSNKIDREGGRAKDLRDGHPLRRALAGAAAYYPPRRSSTLTPKGSKPKASYHAATSGASGGESSTEPPANNGNDGGGGGGAAVDWNKWKFAMTDDYVLTSEQTILVGELRRRVAAGVEEKEEGPKEAREDEEERKDNEKQTTSSLRKRADLVPWGGLDGARWWPQKDNDSVVGGGKAPDEAKAGAAAGWADGWRLIASYLKIMKWPENLHAKFPFKLCADGCDSEVAILHTLEWREKYRPWCVSASVVEENESGFIYHRGHSRAGREQRKTRSSPSQGAVGGQTGVGELDLAGHSMVWYRPGKIRCRDPEVYVRAMISVFDRAVGDSLVRNDGTIGRFNAVLDCRDSGISSVPGLSQIKRGFLMLQDHFPDRLGVLIVVNLSRVGQMLMGMMLPFVSEDVRAKIHIMPNDAEARREMWDQFIDEGHVPEWLGGRDGYVFDASEYYEGGCSISEEDSKKYITTMPYHA